MHQKHILNEMPFQTSLDAAKREVRSPKTIFSSSETTKQLNLHFSLPFQRC